MAFVAAAIAANRFGFGARAGELRIIASDPRGWLLEEIEADLPIPTALAGLPTSIEILARFQAGQMAKRRGRQERDAAKGVANDIRRTMIPQYLRQVVARVETAIYTETSFRERLVHFWANHFAVSADKPITVGIAGTLEKRGRAAASHRSVRGYVTGGGATPGDDHLSGTINARLDRIRNSVGVPIDLVVKTGKSASTKGNYIRVYPRAKFSHPWILASSLLSCNPISSWVGLS